MEWVDGIMAVALLTEIVLHPDPIIEYLTYALENRCYKCGYRLDHPIVKHEYPWKGHDK